MSIRFRFRDRKIFCIGRNKTGTTSLHRALENLGYTVGRQEVAELLMEDWAKRDFRRIIQYCKSADAFQDVPFSLDYTYQVLDHVFPGSKFILTIRNNEHEWYESLVRYHSKIMKVNGIPTADDLKNYKYRRKGWLWRQQQLVFGAEESTLYNEKLYKTHYVNHNNRVLDYFRFRRDDLLVLNLSDITAMQSLCGFLEIEYVGQAMPHVNRSRP